MATNYQSPQYKLLKEFRATNPHISFNENHPQIKAYLDELCLIGNKINKLNLLEDYILSQDLAEGVQL
jgi:hypothetical protein